MSKQDVDQKPVSEDTKQEPVSEDVEQASVVGDADKTDQDKAKEQTCHNEPPDSDEKQRQEGLAELRSEESSVGEECRTRCAPHPSQQD